MTPLPKGPFNVIMADPAWSYKTFSDRGKGRSAERHYKTMTLEEIAAVPVVDIAAKNAHLFLWITGPFLVQGAHLPVMKAWGFKPSTDAFVWVKAKKKDYENGGFFLDEHVFAKGMGHTTRKNAEYVILGRRGKPTRLEKNIHQIIVAPKRQHSRKPDEIYERIEAYSGGPYLEMFGRNVPRPGWQAWGDQVGKFTA